MEPSKKDECKENSSSYCITLLIGGPMIELAVDLPLECLLLPSPVPGLNFMTFRDVDDMILPTVLASDGYISLLDEYVEMLGADEGFTLMS